MLHRGDFLQPEAEVQPGTLAVLPPLKPRAPARADRLDLARWLVDPANPLVRRVMVNQLWSNLFGRGIVRTAERFWRARRAADASRVARLAGGGTGSARLEPQGDDSPDRRVGHVSAGVRTSRRTGRRRSAQRSVPSAESLSGRGAKSCAICRWRSAGLLSDKDRRAERLSAAAARHRRAELRQQLQVEQQHRRGSLPPRDVHVLQADRAASEPDDVRLPRLEHDLHRAPHVEHAAASADHAQQREFSRKPRRPWPGACCPPRPATIDERLALALRWCVARPPTDRGAGGVRRTVGRKPAVVREPSRPKRRRRSGQFKPESASAEEAAAWVATVRIMLNLDEFLTRE